MNTLDDVLHSESLVLTGDEYIGPKHIVLRDGTAFTLWWIPALNCYCTIPEEDE